MASSIPTPEQSAGMLSPATAALKPHRVLACVLCQQRKVKCDRRFPCANCIKAGTQCVPAALLPRQRRRRFPERELLDRLRHYENLLRKNNIPFQPLHDTPMETYSMTEKTSDEMDTEDHQASERTTDLTERPRDSTDAPNYQAQNFWHAMNRKSQKVRGDDGDDNRDADDSDSSSYLLREVVVKDAWDQLYDSNDHLLFCSRNTSIDLPTMHPPQAQIFKLWQVYLDNVNPLLKVTHTPTLQARIIDAASDITNISPPLEALMFGIYCVSVFSLSQEQCVTIFGASREDVLRGYQLAAREALLNSGFLRSSDRDCLTALHFYLISIKPGTDPRSLSSMLGSAIRIAQRMGIDREAANVKFSPLEAELRRRLWWSLVLFDARLSEMTEFKLGMLIPTWDCKIPLNVNDFDLRAEMTSPPTAYNQPSEALFAFIRSGLGDFTRHSPFFLDFINPILKTVARPSSASISDADQLAALETQFEDKYLKHCDPQNPLHFMTIWTCRASLAKSRFVHHLSTCARSGDQQTDAQRLAGMTYALTMLECDTKLMQSPLLGGFHWLIYLNFPFPAYVHLLEDLRRRPHGHLAETAWKVMSDNCSARFLDIEKKDNPMERKDNPFFKIFAGVVLQAWASRETVSGQQEVPPLIVSRLKEKMAHIIEKSQSKSVEQHASGTAGGGALTPDPLTFGNFDPLYNMSGHDMMNSSPGPFPTPPAQPFMAFSGNQWIWPPANWNSMLGQGW